jgi:hypothetical protein
MVLGSTQLGTSQYGSSWNAGVLRSYLVQEAFSISEQVQKCTTKTIQETFTISEHIDKARAITVLEQFTISERVAEILNGENAVWVRLPKQSTNWDS